METHVGQALLDQTRIIVIVRGVGPDDIVPLAEALYEGGIRVMEVTLNTEGALRSIRELVDRLGERMWIGAGTVLDEEDARLAIEAGARFLVTPNMEEAVIRSSVQRDVPIYPGAMTPTEIVRAWKAGAEAVKIFPGASLGLPYIKELQGPLSHIPMVAVGGVRADTIQSYLEAGCHAVGVGGSLVDRAAIAEGRFDRIAESARELVAEVEQYRVKANSKETPR